MMYEIPASVMEDRELEATHVHVYAYLTQHPHTMLAPIQRFTGFQYRTVLRALHALRSRGHIFYEKRDRIYEVAFEPPKEA